MKIIRKNQAKFFRNSDDCGAFEYGLGIADMGGARVEVRGRYPEGGRVVNSRCREVAYILEGMGIVSIEGINTEFAKGDAVLIEAGERYFWQGDFSAFLFSVPAWTSDQLEYVD